MQHWVFLKQNSNYAGMPLEKESLSGTIAEVPREAIARSKLLTFN